MTSNIKSVLRLLWLMLALVPASVGFAQTDSVKAYIDSSAVTTNSVEATALLNRAIELAFLKNDASALFDAYRALARFQMSKKYYAYAIQNFTYASEMCGNSTTAFGENECFNNELDLIRAYYLNNDWSNTQQRAQLLISRTSSGDIQSHARLYLAMALCKSGNSEQSLPIFNLVKQEANQRGDQKLLAEAELELGNCLIRLDDITNANQAFKNAVSISNSNGYVSIAGNANSRLANNYMAAGDYFNAEKVIQEGLNTADDAVDPTAKARLQIELGNTFIQNNNLSEAEDVLNDSYKALVCSGNTNVALATAPGSTFAFDTLAARSTYLRKGALAFRSLADGFADQNNTYKALQYYRQFAILQDSAHNALERELREATTMNTTLMESQQKIELLEKERKVAEKSIQLLEQEKGLQNQQLLNRNLIIGSMIALLLFVLSGAYWLYRTQQARRKADMLLTLQSLSGQMNPHFIFNALNSVNEFIARNDEREANRYLTAFSKLMRQVLDDSKETFIPVQEEVSMLQLYLQLEHARFSDKFSYQFDVSDEVLKSDLNIPPMLIQPFVENAVWHGLRYRDGHGQLQVKWQLLGNDLLVTIKDNGIGIDRSKALKTQHQKRQHSMGISNTQRRVALINELYRTGISIEVKQTSDDEQHPGVMVEIRIPSMYNK